MSAAEKLTLLMYHRATKDAAKKFIEELEKHDPFVKPDMASTCMAAALLILLKADFKMNNADKAMGVIEATIKDMLLLLKKQRETNDEGEDDA